MEKTDLISRLKSQAEAFYQSMLSAIDHLDAVINGGNLNDVLKMMGNVSPAVSDDSWKKTALSAYTDVQRVLDTVAAPRGKPKDIEAFDAAITKDVGMPGKKIYKAVFKVPIKTTIAEATRAAVKLWQQPVFTVGDIFKSAVFKFKPQDRDAVRTALKDLVAKGLTRIKQKGGPGRSPVYAKNLRRWK